MGVSWDDGVRIEHGKSNGDPTLVTVNCPDRIGLGCDITRVILEFGLYVTRGDFSTDGKWCYIVFWVVPSPRALRVDWESMKNRLVSECPSHLISFCFDPKPSTSSLSSLYLLKVFCLDRKGLLHDVTKVLCELELTIQRVKVMTTPDGKVLDLFFITDGMNSLHLKGRRDETCDYLTLVLGEFCLSCELLLAGPEYEVQHSVSSPPQAIADEFFNCNSSSMAVDANITKIKKAKITVDNSLSPAHTLLQIECIDQKGLIYDILRTSKDCDIRISHGRISSTAKGCRNMDLFVQKTNKAKFFNDENLDNFCSRLTEDMLHPLRVTITSRGPDTELMVANPVESSGKGRPLVFFDVTYALKTLKLCIFSAEIVRHSTSDREWEVYRFLLDESREFPLGSKQAQSRIVDRVKRTLMGW
ncbi:hypothetical protein ACJIZ3_012508 [Penstemon smallii]|uniref:ACT domain-containing protein ACR n=1 Tax=Penstemon smallii TaxID=265156 RepID=A0ABD3UM92_9LAMI